MGRRAFTLVELLVIVAVIGIMTTAAVLSVTSGQRAVRVKGATRDVFAAIRQARSTALVTQMPAIITYSNDTEDGEPVAKIEITSAKLFDSGIDRSQVQTLTGAPLQGDSRRESQLAASSGKEGAAKGQQPENEEGRTVEEILFAPISADVVRGMRLKVLSGDKLPANAVSTEERAKPRISVFSNVDYLLGRFKDAKSEAAKQDSEKSAADGGAEKDKGAQPADAAAEDEGPVSIVWETNGRVEPHQVWIYPDGARPEDGLSIRVDRFGGAKVVSGDGRDE
ncbi:MAG: type II secretion system protein [Kiritimatiellae bacterium]|nr:type II secretion system protein [Kiritimatiellia bacterium]